MISGPVKTVIQPGFGAAWPICLGYVPIGLALGVLAQKAGISCLQIAFMSAVVFAGSSQFIAVSMISGNASILAIIITTFVVNLRHLLMSSSLSTMLTGETRKKLSLFAYGVTDESFAINYARFDSGNWDLNRALVLNHVTNLFWVASTFMGGYFGQFIPEHAFGIDFALIAMFICLLVFQLKGIVYIITAILAGVFAVAIFLVLPGNSYIVIAAVIASFAGVWLRKIMGADNRHTEADGGSASDT